MDNLLRRTSSRAVIGAALLLGLAGPLYAGGGVIEFNQARALAGGVTPGDTPGFPVTISQPGSYRLSGNLTVPDANTTAINITANNVTVDLNGFMIGGPSVCTFGNDGYVTSCTPTGTGNGINADWGISGTTVLNGTIQGMGNNGVDVKNAARVEKVRAVNNAGIGILTAGGGSIVTGNIANSNMWGIYSQGDALGVTTNNTAIGNGADGIGGLSLTTGNTTAYNGGFGLSFAAGWSGYVDNLILGWGFGTVNNGNDLGHNICNGHTPCP